MYYGTVLIASVILIRATKRREHSKMRLFMVMMSIGVFISFLQMMFSGLSGLFYGLLFAGFSLYFLICIYSLYDKFKKEESRTVQYLPSVQVYPDQDLTYPYAFPQQTTVYNQQPAPYNPQVQVSINTSDKAV